MQTGFPFGGFGFVEDQTTPDSGKSLRKWDKGSRLLRLLSFSKKLLALANIPVH